MFRSYEVHRIEVNRHDFVRSALWLNNGTTACKWDVVIPFEPLWKEYKRIIKDRGCIALFGSEPFSSALRMSNIKNYKYDWKWEKSKPTGFMLAKKQPIRNSEDIMVFYSKQPTYNPQMIKRESERIKQ